MNKDKLENAIITANTQAKFGSTLLVESSILFMVSSISGSWHKPAMTKMLEAELHLKSALAEIEKIKESSVDLNKEYEG